MKLLAEVFAPLCFSLLIAAAFIIYAVCHVGDCNDAHIDRYESEKETHGKNSV